MFGVGQFAISLGQLSLRTGPEIQVNEIHSNTMWYKIFLFIIICHFRSLTSEQSRPRLFFGDTDEHPRLGIGNSLVFFSSCHHFALLTNRTLILVDTNVQELCDNMICGFESIRSNQVNQNMPRVDEKGLENYSRGLELPFKDYEDVSCFSWTPWDPPEDWWTVNDTLSYQLQSMVPCNYKDVPCSVRYSMKTLISGPFTGNLSMFYPPLDREMETQFLNYSIDSHPDPIFDIGIHLRVKFLTFEADANEKHLDKESEKWLSSPFGRGIYYGFHDKIAELKRKLPRTPIRVFVAGNSMIVKKEYLKLLKRDFGKSIMVYMAQHHMIVHSSRLGLVSLEEKVMNALLVATEFYSLLTSNSLLAWRGNKFSESTLFEAVCLANRHKNKDELVLQRKESILHSNGIIGNAIDLMLPPKVEFVPMSRDLKMLLGN